MRSRGCVELAFLLTGCTPELSPPWLIDAPRELALRYSVAQEPDPARSFAAALPGDTIEVSPFIVERTGPVAPDELDMELYLCGRGARPCLGETTRAPQCSYSLPELPEETCRVGDKSRITLPDIDFSIPVEDPLAYFVMPDVQVIVSSPFGPGAFECRRRLETEGSLDGCFFVSSRIPLARSTLRELLEEEGVEFDAEFATSRPPEARNTNPEVEAFELNIDGDLLEVASGDRVQIEQGVSLRATWLADEELDIQSWEDDSMGEPRRLTDLPGGRWFLSRETMRFTSLERSASWTVDGPPGSVFLFLVVEDSGGGTGWGWLEFEVVAAG